jgi:surface protein
MSLRNQRARAAPNVGGVSKTLIGIITAILGSITIAVSITFTTINNNTTNNFGPIPFSSSSSGPNVIVGNFNSTWLTTNPGISNSSQILLPLIPSGSYNFSVNWGDGKSNFINAFNSPLILHTYSSPGKYFVTITANSIIRGWNFNGAGDAAKLIAISSWGPLSLVDGGGYFKNCVNLATIQTPDVLNLTGVFNASSMFQNCSSLGQISNVNSWSTGAITSMANMFNGAINFNQPLLGWNTMSVQTMNGMFANATNFNGNISTWNTNSLTNLGQMLFGAVSFNQDISNWNFSIVSTMQNMFTGVLAFSTLNYNNLLVSLGNFAAANSLRSGVTLSVVFPFYSCSPHPAATARAILIAPPFSWTIQDSGCQSFCTEFQGTTCLNGGTCVDTAVSPFFMCNCSTVTASFIAPLNATCGFPFVTQWNTEKTSPGSSGANQIALPLVVNGNYNFQVFWGDGNSDTITAWNQPQVLHTYTNPGVFTLKFQGVLMQGFFFNSVGDCQKLLLIQQWGLLTFTNGGAAFAGAVNLVVVATDILNLNGLQELNSMFLGCSSLTNLPNAQFWNTSAVVDMSHTFSGCSLFNGNISGWNTQSVNTMEFMFNEATAFNQPIGSWNTAQVNAMAGMFEGATVFNQDISTLQYTAVSTPRGMNSMFTSASSWTTTNYNTWLIALGAISNRLQPAVSVSIITPVFSCFPHPAGNAHNLLSSTPLDWTITDNGCQNYCTQFNIVCPGGACTPTSRAPTFCNGPFISIWDTTQSGVSANNQIQLPLVSNGVYNFVVAWGDGSSNTITTWNQGLHTYSIGGTYTVNISGQLQGWSFNSGGDAFKLTRITQWGVLNVGNNGGAFSGCGNLVVTATDLLNVTGITVLSTMFYRCTFTSIPNINSWDVSNIQNMFQMFGNSRFNQDISNWDTGNVLNMNGMFSATVFDQPIGSWNTGKVLVMSNMFLLGAFNHPIGDWNTGSVTTMTSMFVTTPFDQPIGTWNTANVLDMSNMFFEASAFNQSIGAWNTENVVTMENMFNRALSFQQDISTWNVTQVTNMVNMLVRAISFTMDEYNALLIGWASFGEKLQNGVTLSVVQVQYSCIPDPAGYAHANLTAARPFGAGWTIVDAGCV